MTTTLARQIPYPDGSDQPNVPYWLQLLAERVDAITKSTPFAVATGSTYGGAVSTAVVFPNGRFTQPPVVTAHNSEGVAWTMQAKTIGGFNYINAVGTNQSLEWVAVQMTSGAAVG